MDEKNISLFNDKYYFHFFQNGTNGKFQNALTVY